MVFHQDVLKELNKNITLSEKLESIHKVLKARFPFIDRIAVAVYDTKTDLLKTFSHSSGPQAPLVRYEAKMSDSRSLMEILETGMPRPRNPLETHEDPRFLAVRHKLLAYLLTKPEAADVRVS